MKKQHTIKYIVAKPYNLKIYSFFINGQSEPHAEHRDDFLEYLVSIIPQKKKEFEKLIFTFKPFFVNVENNEIKELVPDKSKKRTIDSNDFSIDTVMKEINENKNINFMDKDKKTQETLKKIGKNEIFT